MTPSQIHKNSDKAPKPAVEIKPRLQTTADMPGLDVQLAMQYPQMASANAILRLQRLVGNRAVQRLVQRKLVVGAANDSYEREADRVAHQVMSAPAKPVQRVEEEEEEPLQAKPLASSISPVMQQQAAPEEEEVQTRRLVQRQEEEEEIQTRRLVQRQEEEEEVQTKPAAREGSFAPGANFESRLDAQQTGGQVLPQDTREFMENRFGADFGDVRVHTDNSAVQLSRDVQAQAFTHGSNIYFNSGNYNPETHQGKELLAHELTHTLQQTGGAARRIQRLMGRQELLYRAGAPKKSFFMSGTYKAILSDLGKYEAFLQPVPTNAGAFFSAGNKHLNTIETHTDKYLGNHPTGPRTQAIQDLASGIGPERDAYELIRNQFATYKVFPGYMAVNAALAEVSAPPQAKTAPTGGLTLPSTLPTLTPPPPLTLPGTTPKPLPPLPTSGGGTGPTGPTVNSGPPKKPLPPTPTSGGGTGSTGPTVSSGPPKKPLPPTPTSGGGTAPTGPMAGPTQKVSPEEMQQYIDDINNGNFQWVSRTAYMRARNFTNSAQLINPNTGARINHAQEAAIKVYTACDYTYMNPIRDHNQGWFKGSLAKMGSGAGEWRNQWDPGKVARCRNGATDDAEAQALWQEMEPEVNRHARMMNSAMETLDVFKGTTYRGEMVDLGTGSREYDGKYKVGNLVAQGAFKSTSTNPNVGMGFIMGQAPTATNRRVFNTITVKNGRFIDPVSANPGEREVLLLPQTKLLVTKADPVSPDEDAVLNTTLVEQ